MRFTLRNIKLLIEYDGSRYDGWQRPAAGAKGMTVQEKLEEILCRMDGEKIEVIGAARTEAGVHASGQVANFHSGTDMSFLEIKHYLNRFLPRDIAVRSVDGVPERFHASYLAKAFRYEYHISIGEVPSVFGRKYNYYSFKRPDVKRMREAAKYFVGEHDFAAFSENKRMKKSTVRRVSEFDVYGDEEEVLISMTADDFWPYMARIMAGTLLSVGRGEIEPAQIVQVIGEKDRTKAGERLEARGLFLTDVYY